MNKQSFSSNKQSFSSNKKQSFFKEKYRVILSVLVTSFLVLTFVLVEPLHIFAQTTSSNLSAIVGGLIVRNPADSNAISSNLYFLKGLGGPVASNIVGQISAYVFTSSPAVSALQFFSNNGGKPVRGLTILPDGSLFAGGYSDKNTPDSATRLDTLPPLVATSPERARGVYDFYFGTLLNDPGTSPRLFVRSIMLTERRDPPDLTFRRAGPDNGTLYGAPKAMEAGKVIGSLWWSGFAGDDYHGAQVQVYARADAIPARNNAPGSLYLATSPTGSHVPLDRIAIRSNGFVGIGTDDPSALLHVAGDAIANGSWRQSSDIRLKEDIKPLENSLDKVLGLKGVSFKFKKTEDQATQIGVIAQEVERIVPEVVRTEADGYKSVSYQNLVPLLIEAIKEQQKQLDSQKEEQQKQLDSQKQEIEYLKGKVNNSN